MTEKKDFFQAFDNPLKEAGFSKKGQSWYLNGSEVIVVVNLQHSNWGDNYYTNLGFWIKALGTAAFPPYNQCHLYYRVEAFFPDDRDLIHKACDLKEGDNELVANLASFISIRLIPFLKDCTEEKKLREMMSQGLLSKGFIKMEVRWYLTNTTDT